MLGGLHPAKIVALGYLAYILLGWLLLSLPFVENSNAIHAIDNLFTATSAVSTTGLVTLSVSDNYNFWGELIILCLIQVGGIGYMTFGSFVVLSRGGVLTPQRERIAKTVFALPASFRIDKFVRSVIAFACIIEFLGALSLYWIFSQNGVSHPLWSAIFHSVSAFCTAGFSLFDNSFEQFKDNFWLNATIATLSYLGAVGFIVCVDFWRRFRGKIERVTLTSKIILWSTFWLSAIGTFLIFVAEPSIQSHPVDQRLMEACFQAMTSITTVGFNTINIGVVSKATMLLMILLMVVGASPAGTGGGLKSTTLSALTGLMRSALSGRTEVRFWGRPVPIERVWTAVAGFGFYLCALFVGSYLLELTESSLFDQNVFEAASALGTVGLSTGITPTLSNLGKLIIVALMYCGRLGPLTFSIALFAASTKGAKDEDNDLAV